MWIDPAYRGLGLARALIDAVETWAAEDGASVLALWVIEGNHGARAMYERCGFIPDRTDPVVRNPSLTAQKLVRPIVSG